jgi:hypothetical protein
VGLLDANGKVRAGLFVTANGPTMQLFDADLIPRAVLGVVPSGPNMSLYDVTGHPFWTTPDKRTP